MLKGGKADYDDDGYVWEEYGIETNVFAAIAVSVFGLVVLASLFQGGTQQQQWGS